MLVLTACPLDYCAIDTPLDHRATELHSPDTCSLTPQSRILSANVKESQHGTAFHQCSQSAGSNINFATYATNPYTTHWHMHRSRASPLARMDSAPARTELIVSPSLKRMKFQ